MLPTRVARSVQRRSITTLVMGAPGSGKGTVSAKILADFDFTHISCGDLLRAQLAAGTELGRQTQVAVEKGGLVADRLVIDMMLSVLETGGANLLIEGFPRTRQQAKQLNRHRPVDLALNVLVPFDEIERRLSSRWLHVASGRIYNDEHNPPKLSGRDDETGEPLVQRNDDRPEARRKLSAYEELTAPLLCYYASKGTLKQASGSRFPELVAADRRSDAIYATLKPTIAALLAWPDALRSPSGGMHIAQGDPRPATL